MHTELPVVVIGAGPVGLAAAAHLLERGLQPLLLEAGERVGAGMRTWSHVRMFSPWEYSIDRAARRLLDAHGWQAPDPAAFPTGGDVVSRYLEPLAATPGIAPRLRLGTRVTAVARRRRDRMKDAQRNDTPFVVRYVDAQGEHEVPARAVIDASGTLDTPNLLGASGLPALGETALSEHIAYGLPDVLGTQRTRYAGKRVLVVGSGHSAFNVLSDLARLAEIEPATRIFWALRRPSIQRVLGGGEHDQLQERGKLGQTIGRLVAAGKLTVFTGFELERLTRTPDGIVAQGPERSLPAVDEIVGATGFRPDLRLLSEVRTALDAGTESPVALAPLIDPNLHSCGSVRPHGAEELKHPDADLYIVGMKSYGRAPTFLLLTGYEQVRSVAAAIAGDWEAARRLELVLPETGVCITQFVDEETSATEGCCAAPAAASCESAACAAPVAASCDSASCATPAAASREIAARASMPANACAPASCAPPAAVASPTRCCA